MVSNITNVERETWHPLKIGKGQHERLVIDWSELGNGARRCSAEQHTLFCRWCRARTGKVVQECKKENVQRGSSIEGFFYQLWTSASRFG